MIVTSLTMVQYLLNTLLVLAVVTVLAVSVLFVLEEIDVRRSAKRKAPRKPLELKHNFFMGLNYLGLKFFTTMVLLAALLMLANDKWIEKKAKREKTARQNRLRAQKEAEAYEAAVKENYDRWFSGADDIQTFRKGFNHTGEITYRGRHVRNNEDMSWEEYLHKLDELADTEIMKVLEDTNTKEL